MLDTPKENVIEWVTGDDQISCTLSQRKYITIVKRMAEKYPDKIAIIAENPDGSIFVKMPLKAIHFYLKKPHEGYFSKLYNKQVDKNKE